MRISFFNASNLERIKCTIHITGKLGFTENASKRLNLNEKKSILIGTNDDDKEDSNLYMVIKETIEKEAFKVNKAGNYYYINAKTLFDTLKYDYIKNNISFDLVPIEIEGENIIKMIKKEVPKKGSK